MAAVAGVWMPDWFWSPTTQRAAGAAAAIVVIWLVARAARLAVSRRVKDSDARYLARKLIRFAAFAASIAVVAVTYSSRLAGLTVAFGVAGAGIAFALQEVIASVAGWIAVMSGGFYAPGDRVQLGGIKGDVIDVGVLRTTLMECGQWVDGDLYNGRIVRVANSLVFKEPVVNYSADFPFLWDEIKVPVKYGCDRAYTQAMLEKAVRDLTAETVSGARAVWADVVRSYRIEEAMIDPLVTMVANDNSMEYTIRYVVNYKRRRTTKHHLFNRILDDVDASQGRVALASATFHLVEAPPIRVQLDPPPRA